MSEIITVENNEVVLAKEMIEEITKTEMMAKEIKERQDEMKATILKAMEKYGVKQIKNEMFTISYTAPHVAEKLDTKKLKDDLPTLCEKYTKESEVKSSVRIALNYKNMMKG